MSPVSTRYCVLSTQYASFAAIPDLGLLVIKLLAVVGGVAVGAAVCGMFLKLAAKLMLRRNAPRSMLGVTRLLGGIAGGLLVWAWVFSIGGQGGMGGSGGGWWPFGQGGGKGAGEAERRTEPMTPTEPPAEPPAIAGTETLTITMLGGARVRDQRFYQIDQEPARTWPELRSVLEQRKASLRDLDIKIYKDSVDRDNPAVTELIQWAKDNGITPRLSLVDERMP
jgi:hypothetical protein